MTYWNGEPCMAQPVQLLVGMPPEGLHPQYWAADLIGTVRNVTKVTYGNRVFYLDNENGGGWFKVTKGRGSPHIGSMSLYGEEV